MYALVRHLGRRAGQDRRRPRTGRRWWSASARASTSSPRTFRRSSAHTRDVVFLGRRRDRGARRAMACAFIDFGGRAARARSRSASRGTRSRRRRRATSTSCSRRSSSSRARCATRCSGACRSTRGACSSTEIDDSGRDAGRHRRRSRIVACGTSLARRAGRQVPDRGAGAAAGRGRLRIGVSLPRSDRRRQARCAVVITQSGETADTLAALREAQAAGRTQHRHLQRGRAAWRRARPTATIYTHAGPEIGVASTKAFTSQLVALLSARALPRPARGTARRRTRAAASSRRCCSCPPTDRAGAGAQALVDRDRRRVLQRAATSSTWAAASTTRSRSKGALKLKEISYIHAEGYPAAR